MAYRAALLGARGSSAALIIGATTVTVVANPGPGLRIRVVSITYMLTRSAAGNVEFNLQDSGLIATFRAGLSWQSAPAFSPPLPEPGYSFAANSAVTLQAISTSATGTAECWVLYLVDAVS